MPAPQKPPSKSRLELTTLRIHETMSDPSVDHAWGAVSLKQHGGRRIVWVRVQSPITTPRQAGGVLQGPDATEPRLPGDVQLANARGSRFRICRIRVQTVDAHIYAEDNGAVDRILDNLLAAVEDTVPQTEYVFEDWPMETAANASLSHLGKAVVRMRLRHQVADEVRPLAPLVGSVHECGILQPDGTVKST